MVTRVSGSQITIAHNSQTTTANSTTILTQGLSHPSATGNNIIFDSSGRVFYPSRCYFSAVKTTQQSLPATTWTLANLESTDFNVGSHFDTSTDRFTAPADGYYSFHYTAYFLTSVTGYLYTALRRNGSLLYGTGLQTNSHMNDNTLSHSHFLKLSTNDYVEMWIYHGTTGSLNPGTERTRFSGYLIG